MTGWGWSGVMARAMAHISEKEAAGESRNKEAAEESRKKKKVRRSRIERAMLYNSRRPLDNFLNCPFASAMDLTKIHEFWQNLRTNDIFKALWVVLMVLFEIIFDWRIAETDMLKYVGMGTNPRRAILWHCQEFMSDAHVSRIRTNLRRKLLKPALQSVHSSIYSKQTFFQAWLQDKADKDRKRMENETIQSFLKQSIIPKIRLGQWSMPVPLPKPSRHMIDGGWQHWNDLDSSAEKFWWKEGWKIKRKRPFLRMVKEAFWDVVLTQDLKPYRGSVEISFGRSLDQGECIRDGNDNGNTAMAAACATEKSEKSGVAHAEQEDDLTALQERNLKTVAEASSATELLCQMSWLQTCPDTRQHWDCFVTIMDFCREYILDPSLHFVQAFMQNPEFPSSMRAWSIMPWAALRELERRGQIPRFLAAPNDRKIRQHANMAPEFYNDPGNVNLDLTFYVLHLWDFMTPMALQDILKLSWRDYGTRGEKSSEGPINFRGNVLEGLIGYCHDRSTTLSGGYHAGRKQKPEQASSQMGQTQKEIDQRKRRRARLGVNDASMYQAGTMLENSESQKKHPRRPMVEDSKSQNKHRRLERIGFI